MVPGLYHHCHFEDSLNSFSCTHHWDPLVVEEVVPLHGAELAVGPVPSAQHEYPERLCAVRDQRQGVVVVLGVQRHGNRVLALWTVSDEVCLEHDVFEVGRVEEGEAGVGEHPTGAVYFPPTRVRLHPRRHSLKHLSITQIK